MKAKKFLAAGMAAATMATTILAGCGTSGSSESANGKKD